MKDLAKRPGFYALALDGMLFLFVLNACNHWSRSLWSVLKLINEPHLQTRVSHVLILFGLLSELLLIGLNNGSNEEEGPKRVQSGLCLARSSHPTAAAHDQRFQVCFRFQFRKVIEIGFIFLDEFVFLRAYIPWSRSTRRRPTEPVVHLTRPTICSKIFSIWLTNPLSGSSGTLR